MGKRSLWRWGYYLVGLMIFSFGLALTIKGEALGIGPWDVLSYGLMLKFGGSIGLWTILSGFIIVIGTSFVLKEWPKIGTWLNMILMGTFMDLFLTMLPNPSSQTENVVVFSAGLLVMSVGIGMYVSPNLGAGPRDTLMIVLHERVGMTIKGARTLLEIIAAFIGWLLGGPVGIGTVAIALLIGQLVHYTLPFFQRRLLVKMRATDESALY